MRVVHAEDARFPDERIGDEADDPDQDKGEAENFRQQAGVPVSLDHCEVPFGSVASRDARRRASDVQDAARGFPERTVRGSGPAWRSPGVPRGSCRVSWGGKGLFQMNFC